jgi:hypothetical protein
MAPLMRPRVKFDSPLNADTNLDLTQDDVGFLQIWRSRPVLNFVAPGLTRGPAVL